MSDTASPARTIHDKAAALRAQLAACDSIAVAYSGGVDSSLLADIAHEVLGTKAWAVLADSPSIPRSELRDAVAQAETRGWQLRIIHTEEFTNESYLNNLGNRCYFCKGELFSRMDAFAREHRIQNLAYGENADDRLDPTRFGAKAAREHRVLAPLAENGLTKNDVRLLSKERGLPSWDKPGFACLSSRFPVGTRVTMEDIQKIEAAEEALKREGFRQYRARHYGDTCRIEIEPDDFPRILEPATRERLLAAIRDAGYRHITLDLAGYRMGSTAT